jgi:hypothetical protein
LAGDCHALLKKYLDRYYKYKKQEYESDYLEFRELTEDDPDFIAQYRLSVERSREDIDHRLEEVKSLIETGRLRDLRFRSSSLCT